MTCKTHKILSALRKLRADGFNGKINPAMIRKLTGIERPGKTLCDLRSKDYLIDAGKIALKAAKGTTIANEYRINPKSDLLPSEKYEVAKHQKKLRGNGLHKNNKTSDMRKAIKSYGGEIFSTSQLRKDVGMFPHTFQRLEYLEALGEVKRLDLIKTGGRATMTWQEVKINDELIFDDSPVEFKSSNDPWASVWPEFFVTPMMNGTVRSFVVAEN